MFGRVAQQFIADRQQQRCQFLLGLGSCGPRPIQRLRPRCRRVFGDHGLDLFQRGGVAIQRHLDDQTPTAPARQLPTWQEGKSFSPGRSPKRLRRTPFDAGENFSPATPPFLSKRPLGGRSWRFSNAKENAVNLIHRSIYLAAVPLWKSLKIVQIFVCITNPIGLVLSQRLAMRPSPEKEKRPRKVAALPGP